MTAHTAKAGRFAGLIFSTCLALLLIPAQAADAITVTVAGTTYELGTTTGSFDDNATLLQSQPWWASTSKATVFALALLGTGSADPSYYYRFAYNYPVGNGLVQMRYVNQNARNTQVAPSSSNVGYVTAVAVASSVPEINAGSLSQAC